MQHWRWLGVVLLVLLVGCGDKPADRTDRLVTDPPPGTVALQAIEVAPVPARLALGMPLQLRAIAVLSAGGTLDVSDKVDWRSSDEAVATVAADGNVATHASGRVAFTASLYNKSARVDLEITDARLTVIDITPVKVRLPRGTLFRLAAEGGFSDGSRQDLDGLVNWESLNPDIASVDAQGWLQALRPGLARIVARYPVDQDRWLGATLPVGVVDATLTAVEVAAPGQDVVAGSALSLLATGVFEDAAGEVLRHDVTAQAGWSSGDEGLAVVGPAIFGGSVALAPGRVLALAPGTVPVTASVGSLEGVATLTITDATLERLRIVSPAVTLAAGEALELVLVGEYSDGSSRDLTGQAIWLSGDPALASVTNADGRRGQVTARAGGRVTISARSGELRADFDLTVDDDPARPVSLVLSTGPDVLITGETVALTVRVLAADAARGVADGTVVDIDIVDARDAVVLPTTRLTTSAGIASLDFTPSTPGLLLVRATQPDTGLTASRLLAVNDTPDAGLSLLGRLDASQSGGVLGAGGRFDLRVVNASGRAFTLRSHLLCNGELDATGACLGDELPAEAHLAGTALGGGMALDIGHLLAADTPNNGIAAAVHLTDEASGERFFLRLDLLAAP